MRARHLITLSTMFGLVPGAWSQVFQPPGEPVGDRPEEMLILDMNADGRPDIVTRNDTSQDVSVLLSRPGGFLPAAHYPYNVSFADRLSAADLNADGRPDLVFEGGSFVISYLNLGDGTLSDAVKTPSVDDIDHFAVGDLNGDDLPDVLVCDSAADVIFVHFAEPDGTLAAPVEIGAYPGPRNFIIADFTNDGRNDILFSDWTASQVILLVNLEDVGFVGLHMFMSDPRQLYARDFDLDGTLDFAVTGANAVRFMLNDGDISFTYAGAYGPFSLNPVPVFGEINDDDFPDFVIGHNDQLFAFFNDGTGTFPDVTIYPVDEDQPVWLADIDDDGDNDVIYDTYRLLENVGDGILADGAVHLVGPGAAATAFVDIDLDDDTDIVFTSLATDAVMIYANEGTFDTPVYRAAGNSVDLLIADLDLDGLDDIVHLTRFTAEGNVHVFTSTGDTLERRSGTFAGAKPGGIVAAHLNDDDHLDLAVAAEVTDEYVILYNDGDATFSNRLEVPLDHAPISIDAGDVDADGDVDLVIGRAETKDVVVLLADADGSYAPPVATVVGVVPERIRLAHMNADDRLDAIVLGDEASLLIANDDATFSPQPPIAYSATDVDIADIDADGDADVVIAASSLARIYLGDGDGGVQFVENIDFDNTVVDVSITDLDGQGHLDLIVTTTRHVHVLTDLPDPDLVQTLNLGSGMLDAAPADLDARGGIDLIVIKDAGYATDDLWTIYAVPCAADANADGVLDVLDFVFFQLLWQLTDPAADCDEDGQLTSLDFVCFQQQFDAGCR